jgi:glutamate formiminotransferase / 5-formyltetrahydrofolate cyclo-ligase
VLDVHTDPDHHRTVFTLAGEPGELHHWLVAGARVAVERIDLPAHAGVHPRVGALDVAPIVYRSEAERGAACAEALLLGHRLGRDLGLPVYLYGALAGGCA